MERADIAIIGTGPGGVSAALTAKVRNKNILLIGKKQMSDKVSKAHQIMNYPGLPAVTGADMAKAFEKQLAMMEINITDSRIGTVYAMGDYFAIQAGGEVLEAKSVILACGVVSGKEGCRHRLRERCGTRSGLSCGSGSRGTLFSNVSGCTWRIRAGNGDQRTSEGDLW